MMKMILVMAASTRIQKQFLTIVTIINNTIINNIVLTNGGITKAPFVLNNEANNNKLTVVIDVGSPVTALTTKDFKIIPRTDVSITRLLPHSGKFVVFEQQFLDLAWFLH